MQQCFEAAGLQASDAERREYAALAAEAIVDEGFAVFAEGASLPHGSGSHTVAGGNAVPGFLAYLRSSVPADAAGKLDRFDEIYDRFVEATAAVEAQTGPGGNAAYNRAENAADEILDEFFAQRSENTVRQLHDGFGDAGTAPIDMSKVTVGRGATAGGCALLATLVLAAVTGTAAIGARIRRGSVVR